MSNHTRQLGAGFENEMVASAKSSERPADNKKRAAKRRDVERNYGGDSVKAALMQAHDRGLPTTRVYATMTDEVRAAYNGQAFGYASFKGILISAARLVESGELKASGNSDAEGRVPVNIDSLATLEKLVGMVVAHRESLPVDREDAVEELGQATRSLEFLVGHNNGVDFSGANGLMTQARAEFKEMAFDKGADFRPVVRLLTEAVTSANDAVNESLASRNRRTAATIGEEDRIETEIQTALAMKNPSDVRNALIEQFKVLRGMGATDPEYKPRGDNYRQGTGNRPDRNDGQRRDGYPNGLRRQRFSR